MSKANVAVLDSSLLFRDASVATPRLSETGPASSSTVNATVFLPVALHRRLRVLATHSQHTQQAIIRDALRRYLDQRGAADPACRCMRPPPDSPS